MTMPPALSQRRASLTLADQVHAVVFGEDIEHETVLFAHELLATPRLAMQWLDDRLRHFNLQVPTLASQRRPFFRNLRGDLRHREEWLDGRAHRTYAVKAASSAIWLKGYLCPVRSLPLLTPCLLLETAS